jgi:hypothetical protein
MQFLIDHELFRELGEPADAQEPPTAGGNFR